MSETYLLISFLIAAFGFGFGAVKLFRKRKPLYFQLLVCAAGCFAITRLSSLVNLWCGVTESVSVGMLGIFGCNFFLLSANFGTLDRIVDDGKGPEKARTVAFAAPATMAVLTAAVFASWVGADAFCAVMWLIMLIPALPASYFNLKHILLPLDPFEFLRATKPCNVAALIFYAVTSLAAIGEARASGTVSGLLTILASLSVVGLTISADRGAKQWGI